MEAWCVNLCYSLQTCMHIGFALSFHKLPWRALHLMPGKLPSWRHSFQVYDNHLPGGLDMVLLLKWEAVMHSIHQAT